MGTEDRPPAVINNFFNGRQGGTNAQIIGNISILIQGNVKVNAHKNVFPLQVQVFYTQLRHLKLLKNTFIQD
jgi:hypothetical protein